LWIDLSGNAVNALLVKLTGSRRLAARTTRGGRSMVDYPLPHELQENEYGNRQRVADYLGCTLDFSAFKCLPRESPAPGATVLALTTACRWRNWPMAHFLAVVRAFPQRRFVLTGLTGEVVTEDRAALVELCAQPNAVNLLDRLGLLDLISLIAHAPAVVTNDTAAAHIANAYRRPGGVLFGPENSAVFADPGGLRVFHDRTCPYHPCIQWTCRNPEHWCMKLIPADAVIAHLATLPG
jgi:ADP-heptose:LPS heptosyltransferase